MGNHQRKLIFQPLICKGYVSFREGSTSSMGWQNGYHAIMRCHEFFWFRSVHPAVGNWFGNNFRHGELVKPSQVTYEWLFLITYFLFTYQPGWSFSWPRDDCYPSQLNGISPWATRCDLVVWGWQIPEHWSGAQIEPSMIPWLCCWKCLLIRWWELVFASFISCKKQS